MHHYGKYKGSKETCSPKIMNTLQRSSNMSNHDDQDRYYQFRDTNSSIRYESRLDKQYSVSHIGRYQNQVHHTDSSMVLLEDTIQDLYPFKKQHSKQGLYHMKSVQENENSTVPVETNQQFSRSSFGKQKLKRSNNNARQKSRDSLLNDQLLFNQSQVAIISAKAREVSQKLLIMKNLETSLPLSIQKIKSPHNKSIKKAPAFMNPTESHKTKSMGKVTSKQRLMEVFDFLETNKMKPSSSKQTLKKTAPKKKKSYTLGNGSQSKKAKNQVTVSIQELQHSIDQQRLNKKSRQVQKQKTPIAKEKAKAQLYMDVPASNQAIEFNNNPYQVIHGPTGYASLNKHCQQGVNNGLQQYLDCKAKYNSNVKQSSQQLVHERVSQMQSKYKDVFKKQLQTKSKSPISNKTKLTNQLQKIRPSQVQSPNSSQNQHFSKPWKQNFVRKEQNIQELKNQNSNALRNNLGNKYLRSQWRKSANSHSRSPHNFVSPQNVKCVRKSTPVLQEAEFAVQNSISLSLTIPIERSINKFQSEQQSRIQTCDSLQQNMKEILNKDYTSPNKQKSKRKSETKRKQNNIDKEEREQDNKRHSLIENRLKFLHSKLGAVMKGYKTRRIYHNNKIIRKYRLEFREIIQFAYNLKKDIEHSQEEQIKQLLITALKDLVTKRKQFSHQFCSLLNCEKILNGSGSIESMVNLQNHNAYQPSQRLEWLLQSQPKDIQSLVYEDVKDYSNKNSYPYQKENPEERKSEGRSRPKFLRKGDGEKQVSRQVSQMRSFNRSHSPEKQDLKDRTNKNKSIEQYKLADDQQQTKSPRQMTFGNNTLNQSRNMSIQFAEESEAPYVQFQPLNLIVSPPMLTQLQDIEETENSPVRKFRIESDQNTGIKNKEIIVENQETRTRNEQPLLKREYLRKGSNSRSRYDPVKSIQRQKNLKKQDQIIENPQSSMIYNDEPFDKSQTPTKCYTPNKQNGIEIIERRSALRLSELRDKYCDKQDQKTRTPIRVSRTPKPSQAQENLKQEIIAPQQSLSKQFVSKIPRLSCSLERVAKLYTQSSIIEATNSTKQQSTFETMIQCKNMTNLNTKQSSIDMSKLLNEQRQIYNQNLYTSIDHISKTNKSSHKANKPVVTAEIQEQINQIICEVKSPKKTHSKAVNPQMSPIKEQSPFTKTRHSHSSFLTHQIPVMSPPLRESQMDEDQLEFKVQQIVSNEPSMVPTTRISHCKINSISPQKYRADVSPFKTIPQREKHKSISPAKNTMESPIKEESSPAFSLNKKFMDEIFNRCSPLKRTSFINNYVSCLNKEKSPQNQENLDDTNQIQCHEVKLFSPNKAAGMHFEITDKELSQEIKDLEPSPQTLDLKFRNSNTKKAAKPSNDYSDQVNLEYKLQILMQNDNIQQRNDIGMFDMSVKAFESSSISKHNSCNSPDVNIESTHFCKENVMMRLQDQIQQKIQNKCSKMSDNSNSASTFRLQPEKIANKQSFADAVNNQQLKEQLSIQNLKSIYYEEQVPLTQSPYKRVKYSPNKRLTKNKENITNLKIPKDQTTNKNVGYRRTKAQRSQQKSQSRQTPLQKLQDVVQSAIDMKSNNCLQPTIMNDQPANIIISSTSFNNTQEPMPMQLPTTLTHLSDIQLNFQSPCNNNKLDSTNFERLGYVKRSNSKSPNYSSVLEDKRSERKKQYEQNVYRKSYNSRPTYMDNLTNGGRML